MKRLFRKLTACVLAAVMLFVLLPVSFSMLKAGAEWAPDREWEWIRFRGANRYETSAEIMRWELGQKKDAPFQPQVKMSPEGMGIATGLGFADALGAVSLLGETLSPLLLVADNNPSNGCTTQANIDALVARLPGK